MANIHIEWDFRLVCWQIDLSLAESSTQGLKRWVERDACVAFYPVASKAERERAGKFNCELRQRALFSWHLGVRLLGVDYVSHNVASRVASSSADPARSLHGLHRSMKDRRYIRDESLVGWRASQRIARWQPGLLAQGAS